MNSQREFHYTGRIGSTSYDQIEYYVKGKIKATIPSVKETIAFSPIEDDSFCFTSTKNLWTKEGIFVYEDPLGESPLTTETVIKLHKEGSPNIRFVSYGYKTGEHSIPDFIENPLVIAQLGGDREILELVAKRAKQINQNSAFVVNYKLNPNRFRNGLEDEVIKHTALDSFGLCGLGLHIYPDIGRDFHGRIYGYMREAER